MTIKEIRGLTGLSQVKFCEKYNIPRRTLEDWESGKTNPAEYLLSMLERVVRSDLREAELDREAGDAPVTRVWKVFGAEGHRQKASFLDSVSYDWSDGEKVRKFSVECYDKTGTHEYVVVRITRNTAKQCEEELEGQLSDGFFENVRTGAIEEVI